MPATPEQARTALTVVTSAAIREVAAVAQAAAQDPTVTRAALFAAVPLIVPEYASGSAALAVTWYEDLREAASPSKAFQPEPFVLVTDENLAALVAKATAPLHEVEQGVRDDIDQALAESLAEIESQITKQAAAAFRETIIENTKVDPASVGWRRFARPEACKFCLMLAARGAVYKRDTARFAAHGREMANGRKGGDCQCIAGPAFGGKQAWSEAKPIQYLASKAKRTAKQSAELRSYLNRNFPDAPG